MDSGRARLDEVGRTDEKEGSQGSTTPDSAALPVSIYFISLTLMSDVDHGCGTCKICHTLGIIRIKKREKNGVHSVISVELGA